MPVGFTDREKAELVRRLKQMADTDFQQFANDWFSLNALYNAVKGNTERDRLMNVVRKFATEAEAEGVLVRLEEPIAFLSRLPPGDMRRGPQDPDFRKRTTEALDVVNDASASPVERLAHLMAVVYQIRCNLIHGDKDPDPERDRDLVARSRAVLAEVLPVVSAAAR